MPGPHSPASMAGSAGRGSSYGARQYRVLSQVTEGGGTRQLCANLWIQHPLAFMTSRGHWLLVRSPEQGAAAASTCPYSSSQLLLNAITARVARSAGQAAALLNRRSPLRTRCRPA